MDATKKNKQDFSTEILIEEYISLRELIQSTMTLRDGRLNSYLTAISGAFIGLGLLSQLQSIGETARFISAGIGIGIFLIGLANFRNVIRLNFDIVKYRRGMNRIRQYFIKNHKNIQPYFLFPANDDVPSFKTQFPSLTAVIISTVPSIGIPLLFAQQIITLSPLWIYALGIFVFVIAILALRGYFLIQAQREEKMFNVQFQSQNSKHR